MVPSKLHFFGIFFNEPGGSVGIRSEHSTYRRGFNIASQHTRFRKVGVRSLHSCSTKTTSHQDNTMPLHYAGSGSSNSILAARNVHKTSLSPSTEHSLPDKGNELSLDELESFLDGGDDPQPQRVRRGRWDIPDGRLDYRYPLYLEGMLKPACRGYLHLVCSVLVLPPALYYIVQECHGNLLGVMSSTLFVLSTALCYGCSAAYHVGSWSRDTEILLQKMDHAGIAAMSVGTFLPCIFLLFPAAEGTLFLLMLMAAFLYSIYGIVNLKPSVTALALIPAVSALFIPRMYVTFTSYEMTLYFIIVLLKAMGAAVFVVHKPDPFPNTFGYHEIFHCFVVTAGCGIYLCNYSIVRRVCNPYAHHIDAVEHLIDVLDFER